MITLIKPGRVPSSRYLMKDILRNENWVGTIINGVNVPAVNIQENETEFVVEVTAPGCQKEDFKVHLQEGILSISAQTTQKAHTEGKNFTRKEFSYSSFNRSFILPKNIMEDSVKAKYDNGLLHISLKKKQDAESSRKQITIE